MTLATPVVLRAAAPLSASALARSAAIVRRRLVLLGLEGARVNVRGRRELVVASPRPAPAALLGQRGVFGVYDAERELASTQRGVRLRGPPALTGADLARRSVRARRDEQTGQAIVVFRFTPRGAARFRALTRTLAVRGRLRRKVQHLGFVLDASLVARPFVDYRQFPNGIDASTGVELAGLRSPADARRVAALLGSGTLRVRFVPAR